MSPAKSYVTLDAEPLEFQAPSSMDSHAIIHSMTKRASWLYLLRNEISRSERAVMSLDVRGRLVANKAAVFSNKQIMEEIEAAKILGNALQAISDRPEPGPSQLVDDEG